MNLRDSYTREVKRRKKAKSGTGKKQHVFFAWLNFLQPITTNKETSNTFQGAKSSEKVSTADPFDADQRVARVSPRKLKQNRLLSEQKLCSINGKC